jgi:antitoxin component YwqK of YwqJK toxin-antitoxin module
MKYFLTTLLVLFTLTIESCADTKRKETKTEVKPQDLVEIKEGHYKEWYPGKKQVKYEGALNKKGDREGKWNFYSEKGTLLSFTFYNEGKKNGHSVVKYPDGKIHYYGQYQDDQMVGEWVTYNEKGEKSIQNFNP